MKHVSGFIDGRQNGFLANKSCVTNMVGLCDSLALSINDNILTDVIYFDFAKAFDSVNHDIILSKLKYKFNVDGRLLKFIANYLKDRQQRVIIGNEISSPKCALSGVPQGSILGPLLSVLFINDLPSGLSPGTQLSLTTCQCMRMTPKSGALSIQNMTTVASRKILTTYMIGLYEIR